MTAPTGGVPRRDRTPLQQEVARYIDDAIDRLLGQLEALASDTDIADALALEGVVDLADAWTDYCDQEDR